MASTTAQKKKKFVLKPGGQLPENLTTEEISIRWLPEETKALEFMRNELKDELSKRNSTVDSDARLMRFLKRHAMDPLLATTNYRDHLVWRNAESVDDKHDLLLLHNLSPQSVPNGKRVVQLMPQIPCSFDKCDLQGNPLSIEYYGFNPENVLQFTPSEYMEWFIYSMEYKMLILEHFSLLAEERAVAQARQNNVPLEPGWGSRAMRRLCVIRDLKGFQLSTSITPRIPFVKELLKMSQHNYPYLTDHSFFTNTPWMFSVVWSVLKSAVSAHTRTKLHMYGSDYHGSIEKFISNESLPKNLQRYEKPKLKQGSSTKVKQSPPVSLPGPSVDAREEHVEEQHTPCTTSTTSSSASSELTGPQTHTTEPPSKTRMSFLSTSTKSSSSKSQKGSSVILSISEAEYPIDRPPPCTRLTVKAMQPPSQPTLKFEDSQEFRIPLLTRHFFVLSLGEDSIVDNILNLDFELSLSNEAECTCSKLQVLIHPEVAVESLLCWVNFYNKDNESLCMLKVVVSYQPVIHSQQSRSGFSSFFKKKNKKKHQLSQELMSSFKAQQVLQPPPPPHRSSKNRKESNKGEQGETAEEDEEEEEEEEIGGSRVPDDDNLIDMFSSYFQFEQPDVLSASSSEELTDFDDTASWYSWSPQSGTEVPLDDDSTEWAIFSCSAIEVRKFAFENEAEAREALEDWSFANILTRSNIEVDVSGIILAPNIGRIREAIDAVRPSPSALKSAELVRSTAVSSGNGNSQPKAVGNPDAGSINNEFSDWAVWTSEFFTVQRYGFEFEQDAKCAMEEWMSVRILTYKEEEVNARCRWHTDAILTIRDSIAQKITEANNNKLFS